MVASREERLPSLPLGLWEKQPICLGNVPVTRTDWGPALLVSVGLVLAFVVSAPQADLPMRPLPAFVPIYNAVLIVLDLITAALLHAQYRQLGERSFLALACGYLFSPVLIVVHGLSFPDAFVVGSVIGDRQTTAWLWMGWHGLFPLFVIVSGRLAKRERQAGARAEPPARRTEEVLAFSATLLLAAALIALGIWNEGLLPPLMNGSGYRSYTPWVLATGWVAHLVALVVLIDGTRLRRRIDVWVAVSMLALLINLALSAVLVSARYQLGFYLGRVYGFLAASFVLVTLLRATTRLYADLSRSAARQGELDAELRRANDELEARVKARTAELETEVRERRALALRIVAVQEEERQRVARELHDSIGQLAAGLSLTLKAVESSGEPRASAAKLTQARRLSDEIAREAHSLAVCLRPPTLQELGLLVALRQLVDRWSVHTNVPAELESAGVEGWRLPADLETAVYRVVQEALTNAGKHAEASRVSVVVTRANGQLAVVVEDDGKGFEPERVAGGRLGLLGMRERAKLASGSLEIETSPGAGCTVILRVPLAGVDERSAIAPRGT